MARHRVKRAYRGIADAPVAWEQLSALLLEIWGEGMKTLPRYPQVIGGTFASWVDAEETSMTSMLLTSSKQRIGECGRGN